MQAIVNGISATEIVPGRSEVIDEDQEFGVIIDAANTPESLSRLLDSVREAGARKIFLVFGCQGGDNKEIRPFMGEIAHYKVSKYQSCHSIIVHVLLGLHSLTCGL